MGHLRQFGSTIDFSETPGLISGPPPRVGEHTREILDWLGVEAARIGALRDSGVVYWPDEEYAQRWAW
jgi:crotonobetainyl-CoA:carnitine CoA-transferase CaiB-like acyl-CoA transferase